MEADSHLGLTNRLAGAAGAPRLPGLPDRGRDWRRATASPAGRSAAGDRPRTARGAGSGSAPDETCVLVFGGSLGARSINRRGDRGVRRRGAFRVLHAAGERDYPELRRAGLRPALRPARVHRAGLRRCAARPPTWWSRAPGGSVFEIAAHGVPAVLVPYPYAAGDHQSANARCMARCGRGGRDRGRRADGGAPGRRGRQSCSATASGSRAMAAASRALARPDAAGEVARELLGAAGG